MQMYEKIMRNMSTLNDKKYIESRHTSNYLCYNES